MANVANECVQINCCNLTSCNLLNWKDAKTTGALLAIVNFSFFSMFLTSSSFITIIANVLLVFLLLGISICYFMEVPPKNDLEYEYFSKDTYEALFKSTYSTMICLEDELQKIYKIEDSYKTFKVLGAVYLLSIITSNICNSILIWVALNLLFLIPLILKFKEKEINEVYSKVSKMVLENLAKLEKLVPRYVEKK